MRGKSVNHFCRVLRVIQRCDHCIPGCRHGRNEHHLEVYVLDAGTLRVRGGPFHAHPGEVCSEVGPINVAGTPKVCVYTDRREVGQHVVELGN